MIQGKQSMKNIIETVSNHSDLRIFLKAIMETGLYDILSEEGPFTIFAPTDIAFQKLPKKRIEQLFLDKEKLTEVLTSHIILKKLRYSDLKRNKNSKTANGNTINFNRNDGYNIDISNFIKKDIFCRNGVIHTINELLD